MLTKEKIIRGLKNPYIIAVSLFRFLSAFTIVIDPFWGMIIYLVFDNLDSFILEDYAKVKYVDYELVDKIIDWLTYFVMLFVAFQYGYFAIFLGLFLFRTIGFLLFEITTNEKYLMLFPNIFEALFVLLISIGSKYTLPTEGTFLYWFLIIFFIAGQILREVIIHYIYPKHFHSGIIRYFLKKFGYSKKRLF